MGHLEVLEEVLKILATLLMINQSQIGLCRSTRQLRRSSGWR